VEKKEQREARNVRENKTRLGQRGRPRTDRDREEHNMQESRNHARSKRTCNFVQKSGVGCSGCGISKIKNTIENKNAQGYLAESE
jgi:hypothetical protein